MEYFIMNKIKLGGVLLAIVATTLPFSQARAEAIASAVIEFYDFRIFGSTDGGQTIEQMDVADFRPLTSQALPMLTLR